MTHTDLMVSRAVFRALKKARSLFAAVEEKLFQEV